jgi:hypothetical protein
MRRNATEMLHMLITALCPAIRQLFSRRRDLDLEGMASQHYAAAARESFQLRSADMNPVKEEEDGPCSDTKGDPPVPPVPPLPPLPQPALPQSESSEVSEESLLKALGMLLRDKDGQPLSEEALARALHHLATAGSASEEDMDAAVAAKVADAQRHEEDVAARNAAVQAAAAAAADAAAARAAAQANVEELEQAAAEMRQALEASALELQKHQALAEAAAPAPPAAAAAVAAADPAAMAAAVRNMTPAEIAKSPELQLMLREMADSIVLRSSEPHIRMAVTVSEQVCFCSLALPKDVTSFTGIPLL